MSKILDINARAARSKTRVGVCVPCQHRVSSSFMYDLVRMMTATASNHRDIELRLFLHRGSILPAQRQALVRQALAAECTHTLWLDSDMRFPKDTLTRLLAHKEAIVAANYVTRALPIRPVAIVSAGDSQQPLFTLTESTGLTEVVTAGLGCVLVDCEVYKQMPEPWFQFWYDDRGAGSFVGEDAYFFLTAREMGLKVMVDQDLSKHVAHIGEYEFVHDDALEQAAGLVAEAIASGSSGN